MSVLNERAAFFEQFPEFVERRRVRREVYEPALNELRRLNLLLETVRGYVGLDKPYLYDRKPNVLAARKREYGYDEAEHERARAAFKEAVRAKEAADAAWGLIYVDLPWIPGEPPLTC